MEKLYSRYKKLSMREFTNVLDFFDVYYLICHNKNNGYEVKIYGDTKKHEWTLTYDDWGVFIDAINHIEGECKNET